jgi:hypothetical protein
MEKTKTEERFENITSLIILYAFLGLVGWFGFFILKNICNAYSCEIDNIFSSLLYEIQNFFSIIFKGERA